MDPKTPLPSLFFYGAILVIAGIRLKKRNMDEKSTANKPKTNGTKQFQNGMLSFEGIIVFENQQIVNV